MTRRSALSHRSWLSPQWSADMEKALPQECFLKCRTPTVDRTEGGRCAPEGTRTPNPLNRNQMLYPLSYGRFAVWLSISLHASRRDANQMIWPEAHSSFASCGRPKTSSIYRDPPRTRQRTLILLHSCPGEVRMIPSRGGPATSIHVFRPRAQPLRSHSGQQQDQPRARRAVTVACTMATTVI